MKDQNETLKEMTPRTPRRVLWDIAHARKRANAGENVPVPMVTLHLHPSRDISGWILSIGTDTEARSEGDVIVLHLPDGSRFPGADVAYIPMSMVTAVSVYDVVKMVDAMAPLPTKMDVKRMAAELADAATTLIGKTISCDVADDLLQEKHLQKTGEYIHATIAVLKEIADDKIGKEALTKKVGKLTFTGGKELSAAFSKGTLTLTVATGTDTKFYRSDLKAAIEAVL